MKSKLSSSGATVTPLNIHPAMELSIPHKKRRGSNKHFQQMLTQGKGVSVFETVRKERREAGETAALESLADPTLFDTKDNDGFTILHHAARCNQAETINLLLDNGMDIDLVENKGFTALHIAVR